MQVFFLENLDFFPLGMYFLNVSLLLSFEMKNLSFALTMEVLFEQVLRLTEDLLLGLTKKQNQNTVNGKNNRNPTKSNVFLVQGYTIVFFKSIFKTHIFT